MTTKFQYFLILFLLLIAFALRLSHLLAGIFHIDEYISMLAAQMTAQKGAPILPSGLLYHQGLLTSYLAAPFIGLLGFGEEIARWPSLLVGLLTVAAFYRIARQVFQTKTAGLFALAFASLDTDMILWSARMRMYALAILLMTLALYFLLQGTLLQPRRSYRLAAAGCYLGAILAHSVAIVALPVWALTLSIGLIIINLATSRRGGLTLHPLWDPFGKRKRYNASYPVGGEQRAGEQGSKLQGPDRPLDWYRSKTISFELVIVLALLAIGLSFAVGGQVSFLSPSAAATSGAGDGNSGIGGVLNKFLEPGLSWQRVDDFFYYYLSSEYWLLSLLAGVSFLWAVVAVAKRGLTQRDLAVLFLGLIALLTIAELSLTLNSTWRKTRYLFILCHPALLLLAADGLTRLLASLLSIFQSLLNLERTPSPHVSRAPAMSSPHFTSLLASRTLYSSLYVPTIGLIIIFLFWTKPALDVATAQGTGGYDTAFEWVKEQWQEGDRLMTVHPSAAYLYLGHSDYYATQSVARVLIEEESEEVVDRYVGSTLIDSRDDLTAALSQAKRLWFVVDTDRLFSRYEPLFIQQIFAQMNVVYQAGPVLVLLSQPYPHPMPAEPTVTLKANFGRLIELGGYSLNLAQITPDRTVQLGLYWRPQSTQFPKPYKVFVQLRDEQGQNIAQADHLIFESFLTNAVLRQLHDQGEWLRDSADLTLPQNLPPGVYRLFVGLYDPATFERVPVIDDASGENAVLLESISIQ